MGDKDRVQSPLTGEFVAKSGSGVHAITATFSAPKLASGEAFVIDTGRIAPSMEEKNKRFGMESGAFEALPERVREKVVKDFIAEQSARYQDAHDRTFSTYEDYLFDAKTKAPLEVRDVAISSLDAELTVLEQQGFKSDTLELIQQGMSAEVAVDQSYENQIAVFRAMEDPYLRKFCNELEQHRAVTQHHLHPDKTLVSFSDIWDGAVIVSPNIPLAAISAFEDQQGNRLVKGVVTAEGSMESHAAILIQAMGIPYARVSDHDLKRIKNGDPLALDGQNKAIILHPSKSVLNQFGERVQEQSEAQEHLLTKYSKKKSVPTLDGEKVNIHANFALSSESHGLRAAKPAGIGLYRTEVLASMRGQNNKPSVEIWKNIFKSNMASCSDKEGDYIGTTFRTVDFDGDKSEFLEGLTKEEIAEVQASMTADQFEALALLQEELAQEGKKNKIKVMIPMIESSEHMMQMQKIMDERAAKVGLKSIKLGCMLEVPSLIGELDSLDTEFISIGTNDLIANLLYPNSGRYSKEAKEKYDPTHPSVVKALMNAVQVGEKRDIPVSLCGKVASDPKYTAMLIGVGLRNMSCGVDSIPMIKEMATRIDTAQAQDLVKRMINEPIRAKREEMLTAFNESLGLSPDGTIDLDWAPPKKPADELDLNPNGMN